MAATIEAVRGARAAPSGSAGAVLLAALLIVSMVMLLGTLSVTLVTSELQTVGAAREDAVTRHLTDAATALVIQWFHDPLAVPDAIPAGLFEQRHELSGRGPSFFDGQGRSQFSGTSDAADVLLLASHAGHDRLLHDPGAGLLRGLGAVGRLLAVKLYRPERLGLLGTIEVTAVSSGSPRTTTVQLGARRIPRLRAAAQVGHVRTHGAADMRALLVHWGDLVVVGDASFGALRDIPVKRALAPVTGRSYGAMRPPEDRWVDYFVGGTVSLARAPGSRAPMPGNIHGRQSPIPGLRLDAWDYHELKQAALQFGSYYVLGRDGYLYPDGTAERTRRRTVDDAFRSDSVGDHRGLVFIDTPDRSPPGSLETVTITVPYAEGVFVVNAHVLWRPGGTGRSVPALSPPPEGMSSARSRIPVTLSGIHLQGVLVTPGQVSVSGHPRLYGGLSCGETVQGARGPRDRLEVWYSHELERGLARGLALVYVLPETRRERW